MSYVIYNTYKGESQIGDYKENPNRPFPMMADLVYKIRKVDSVLSAELLYPDDRNCRLGLRFISPEVLSKISGFQDVAAVQKFVHPEMGTRRRSSQPYAINLVSSKQLDEHFMEEVFGFCSEGITSYGILKNLDAPENLWSKEKISEEIDESKKDKLALIISTLIKSSSEKSPNGNIAIKTDGDMTFEEREKYSRELLIGIYSLIPYKYRKNVSFSANSSTDKYEKDQLMNIVMVSENFEIEKLSGFDKTIINPESVLEDKENYTWLYKWMNLSTLERRKLCDQFNIGKGCNNIAEVFKSVAKTLLIKNKISSMSEAEQEELMNILSSYDEAKEETSKVSSNITKLEIEQRSLNFSIERNRKKEEIRRKAKELYDKGDLEGLKALELDELEYGLKSSIDELIKVKNEQSTIKKKLFYKNKSEKLAELEGIIDKKTSSVTRTINTSSEPDIEKGKEKIELYKKKIDSYKERKLEFQRKVDLEKKKLYEKLKGDPELLHLIGDMKKINFGKLLTLESMEQDLDDSKGKTK